MGGSLPSAMFLSFTPSLELAIPDGNDRRSQRASNRRPGEDAKVKVVAPEQLQDDPAD